MKTRVFNRFSEIPSSYEELFSDVDGRNYFFGGSWFKNFVISALELAAHCRIYAIENNDFESRPRAVLVTRTPANHDGSIFHRQLLRRRNLSSMTSHQSVFYGPILSKSDNESEAVLRKLVEVICAETPPWTMIDFSRFDSRYCDFELLSDAFRSARMVVCRYKFAINRYEDVKGKNFTEFLKSRPSVVRITYQRMARNFYSKFHGHFELVHDESDVESAILSYERVLSNSWKESESFPNHSAGLIRSSAAAGTLRLGFLYIDDQPISAQIWIVSAGRATAYKMHYDLSVKRYSVGSILTMKMCEHVIDVDNVEEINLGVGDEFYKRNWASQKRTLDGFLAFNPRTVFGVMALITYITERAIYLIRRKIIGVIQALTPL